MSRRSRRRRDVLTPTPSLTAPPLSAFPASSLSPSYPSPRSLLAEIAGGDRRYYHPLQEFRPAVSFSGADHALGSRDRPQSDRFAGLRKFPSQTKALIAFRNPDHTLVCVRRRTRKEVLHALRKTGAGGPRKRNPRKNWFSKIHC